jgi:formylglycine-generating enzyme required for sulfatase activity
MTWIRFASLFTLMLLACLTTTSGALVSQSAHGQSRDRIELDEQIRALYGERARAIREANIREGTADLGRPPPPGRCDESKSSAMNWFGFISKRSCIKPGTGKAEWFRDCPECPDMVVVPAGSFTMGSPENELEREASESPQHKVTILQPFAVGRFAVTRGEFAEFAKTIQPDLAKRCLSLQVLTPSQMGLIELTKDSFRDPGFPQEDNHPVVCVTWNDAHAYVDWLKKKTGKDYRLLSEAEREYVARATTTTTFWWGSTFSTKQANYFDDNVNISDSNAKREELTGTIRVDGFESNPWGLYNVHGNVMEWVEDCWHDSYVGAPTDGSAWTSGDCSSRVIRGGYWGNSPRILRAAFRGRNPPAPGTQSGFFNESWMFPRFGFNVLSEVDLMLLLEPNAPYDVKFGINGIGFRVARTLDRLD